MKGSTMEETLLNVNSVASVLVNQETSGNMQELTKERSHANLAYTQAKLKTYKFVKETTAVGFVKKKSVARLSFFNTMKSI